MGWGVWHGFEIEGRLTGIHTLFLHSFNVLADLTDIEVWWAEHAHVYVCQEWTQQYGWAFLIDMARAYPRTLLTLEVTPDSLRAVPTELSAARKVITLAWDDLNWLDQLDATDSVRLTGQFETATIEVPILQRTRPAQYAVDELLLPVAKGQSRDAVDLTA